MRASGRGARRDFPHHQGQPREPARRRFRALGGGKPGRAQGRLCRPADGPLAQSRNRAGRIHAGAGQGQAAGAGAPYRRRQFHHHAARRGGRALPRAAGRLAGRVSSLSRSDESSWRPRAGTGWSSSPIVRSDADGCSTIPCWTRSRGRADAASRRWRCAGSCSRTSSPIPFSSKPERIADNFDVFDFTLSEDEMDRISALKRADGRIANPVGRVPGGWD